MGMGRPPTGGRRSAGSPPAPIGAASASSPAKIAKVTTAAVVRTTRISGAVAIFMALRAVSQPGPRRDRSQSDVEHSGRCKRLQGRPGSKGVVSEPTVKSLLCVPKS
jgi:hypothetical protein